MKNKYHLKVCTGYENELLFRHITHHSHILEIWQKNSSELETEFFEVINQTDHKNTLMIQKKGNFLKKAIISKFSDEEVFYKISIGRKSYCGKGLISSPDGIEYRFTFKNKIYLFERRKNYRLRNDEKISLRAKFNGQKYELFDVSSKSLCIKVSANQISSFKLDVTLRDLKFAINKDVFEIDYFKVISIRSIFKPDQEISDFFQVVCLFHKLSKVTENSINKLIDIYAREIEMNERNN